MKEKKLAEEKKQKYVFFFLIFFFLILQLFFILKSRFVVWDEAVYMSNARSYLGYGNYVEEFRFPLLSRILAMAFSLTGESLFFARLIILFFSLLSVTFFYKLIRKLTNDNKIILICLLSFLFFFPFFFYSTKVYADVPALAFSIVSFYFFVDFVEKEKKHNLLLTSLFSILAFLMRFPTIIFAFSYFIFLLSKKKYKDSLLLLSFHFLFYLPWAVYSIVKFDDPIYHLLQQYKTVEAWTTWQPFYLHFFYLIQFSAYILLLPFLVNWLKVKKYGNIFNLILLCISLNFIYFSFFVKLKDFRYLIQYFFLFPLLTGFLEFDEKSTKKAKIFLAFAAIVIFYIIASIFLSISYNARLNQDLVLDSVEYLQSEGYYNTTMISNCWVDYAYYLNAKAYSFWSEDLDYLIELHKPKVIVYSNYSCQSYDKAILERAKNLEKIKEFTKENKEIIIYKVT
jgi:hypothetical protein